MLMANNETLVVFIALDEEGCRREKSVVGSLETERTDHLR
jgi:hypothetical protein